MPSASRSARSSPPCSPPRVPDHDVGGVLPAHRLLCSETRRGGTTWPDRTHWRRPSEQPSRASAGSSSTSSPCTSSPTSSAPPTPCATTWSGRCSRRHDLTWTAFVVLWVTWIWGSAETRVIADETGVSKATLSGRAHDPGEARAGRSAARARTTADSCSSSSPRAVDGSSRGSSRSINAEETLATRLLPAGQKEDSPSCSASWCWPSSDIDS